jgi:phosphoribosylformimino-5-aminoimidazole carboxamide ribotide isomerase
MKFRPCIDLHAGQVKQIIGSSISDLDVTEGDSSTLVTTNFATTKPASEYSKLYARDKLTGGHVIMLGPNNDNAAIQALSAYPRGLQVGGGITAANAKTWLEHGASHVIVTSYVFNNGTVDMDKLKHLVSVVGGKEKLVLDLSCRRKSKSSSPSSSLTKNGDTHKSSDDAESSSNNNNNNDDDEDDDPYYVVTDRWQTYTNVRVNCTTLTELGNYCAEFLVHGVENEGKRCGILEDLVVLLGKYSPVPVTYAGGVNSIKDLDRVKNLGGGRVDLTIGSALDCFGGDIAYDDVVAWHRREYPE